MPETVRAWLEIRPIEGMFADVPGQEIPPGGSPDMLNCIVRGETLRKRPGYSQFGDQVDGDPILGLFSTQDESDTTQLIGVHKDGVDKHTVGTDAWTAVGSAFGTSITGDHLPTFAVSQNLFVIAQGDDKIQVTNTIANPTTVLDLNSGAPIAQFIARFADRLYAAFTNESSNDKPFRVRRPVASDHTDWTGVGSGFNDLAEFPYHIRGLAKHGAQLIVGTEEAIWLATRTGIAGAPARFDPVVTGVGIKSGHTLRSRGTDHAFLGTDNFYLFQGSGVRAIGNRIRDLVFNVLNVNKLRINFSIMKPDSQEYLTFLCTGSSPIPDSVWAWHWGKNIWYPWSVNGPRCATIHRLDATRIWSGLIGSWAEQTWEWGASADQTDYPAMLTGHENGYAYQWDESFLSDAGSAIPCRWTSKDFTAEDLGVRGRQLTLKTLQIVYKDTGTQFSLGVSCSTDGGATWGTVTIVTAGGGVAGYRSAFVYKQVTGDRIRWRITNSTTDETFQVILFNAEFESRGMPLSEAS
jgi:hypothetical protein